MIVDRATLERVGLKNALDAVEWARGCGYSADKALAELASLVATLERVERLLAEAAYERHADFPEYSHKAKRLESEALAAVRGLLAEPQSREEVCEVCEVCEEPVRDLGFIVHPEEGTSICHRCAYELVAAEAKLLREICRTNGWPDLAEPQADDEDQRRENFEQLVTDILVSLDPFLTLLDGPDVDQARESVMRELLAELARLAQVAEGEESRKPCDCERGVKVPQNCWHCTTTGGGS